jgi:hypothetical protein
MSAACVLLSCLAATGMLSAQAETSMPLRVESSVPAEGEADVRRDVVIRVQFSRPMNPDSFADRILVTYSRADSVERGEAQPPAVTFSTTYDAASRTVDIIPTTPLERFRPVRVELLEGIAGADGSTLDAWELQFTTGGSAEHPRDHGTRRNP